MIRHVCEQIESLRGAVQYGLVEGKRNVIADLVVLDELFQQRDALLAACEAALLTRACDTITRDQLRDAIAKSTGA